MLCVGAVCGVVWCRDVLCACCVRVVWVLCVGVVVCWCVVWCVWLCVVWCLLWCGTLKTSVCAFKTFPCVPATCPDAQNMWACCRNTRRHFERTHGDVLNAHTEGGRGEEGRGGSSPVLLTKMPHVGLSLDPREVHQKQPLDITHLRFESKSRTTRQRFLQSFIFSDKSVPLKIS